MHQVWRCLSHPTQYIPLTHSLCLSFNPLLALLMAFRECETFFLGTASSHGGNSSRREGNDGMAHVNGFGAARNAGMNVAASEIRARGALATESHVRDW